MPKRACLFLSVLVLLLCGCKKSSTSDQFVPRPPGSLTYSKDIAPIIYQNCSRCHRPGESGPFNLLTYEDVAKRKEQIVRVTEERIMPPWLPEPNLIPLLGERRLTKDQIGVIAQWAREGSAEGNRSDLPTQPNWPQGWQLGNPDLVIQMGETYNVPAEGKDIYRNFIIPIPTSSRKYVKGVEFRPGNRTVHHAFLRLDRTKEARRLDAEDATPGFDGMATPSGVESTSAFLSWQPGRIPNTSLPGLAWTLEPNTDLVLQVHLQPSGKVEPLQASIGFFFTDETPTNAPSKIALNSFTIDIPAGANNHLVTDSYVLPVDLDLLALLPHAHYLARDMKAFAVPPNGNKQLLFHIKDWNFNWQGDYQFAAPVALEKGTSLVMEYVYDNSTNNTRNPFHPPQRVKYGIQTTDEMGELWLQVLPRNKQGTDALTAHYGKKVIQDSLLYQKYLLELNAQDPKANFGMGKLLYFTDKMPEATRYFQRALQLKPNYDEPNYFLGLIARRQNNIPLAARSFEAAIRANPEHGKAHGNLAIILMQGGDIARAATHFHEAVRINPEDVIAHDSLGIIHLQQGNLPLAEQHLKRAQQLNPNDPAIREHLVALEKAKAGKL